jgi:hypothetical protein
MDEEKHTSAWEFSVGHVEDDRLESLPLQA